jgi:hypothetical protein
MGFHSQGTLTLKTTSCLVSFLTHKSDFVTSDPKVLGDFNSIVVMFIEILI